jgi:hypothetical protein
MNNSRQLWRTKSANRARPCLIVWIKTFTLFVLSPGVENPAAQAGIDCSFCARHAPAPRSGPRQDCVSRIKERARPTGLSLSLVLSLTFACACVSAKEAWRPAASLGTSPRSEDRFKNVRGQKADHGDDYAVADQVIGFVVIFRQHIVLRQAHQTGRFSWR